VVMRIMFMSLFVACAWAQLKIDIHPVTGRASDRLKETERILRIAQRSPQRDANAPEELAMVEAIVKNYRLYFLPEIDSVPGIATLTEKGNDILVAQWTATGTDAFSKLIVWDTPESTSFIFKLPRHSRSDNSAIQATFEKLILPRANGAALDVARDPQTQQRIGAGVLLISLPPRQFDTGYANWVDLWETADASYLCAKFSWDAVHNPPGMRFIPERFPPLESRVRQWSKERLLDQLARGDRAQARDRILGRELVTRDLNDDELLALLVSRRPSENGAVLQAVVDGGQLRRFSNAIRSYLRGAQGESFGKHPNRPPFLIVLQAHDANFTDAALEVLSRGAGSDGAFLYVAEHGATPADYRALADLRRLNDVFMFARDASLLQMRKRLGLDENGNPVPPK